MHIYQNIIDKFKAKYESDENVLAMLVAGSVARGDARHGNDLDILLVVNHFPKNYPKNWQEGDVLVEVGRGTFEEVLNGLENDMMRAYMYLDAKPIFDKNNVLGKLRTKAQDLINSPSC